MSESRSDFRRLFLLLDIDETLVSVRETAEDGSRLSKSAEGFLSRRRRARLQNVELRPEERFHRVIALCQKEWRAVFEAVNTVNKAYKEVNPADPHPIIVLGFLTNASYTANEFLQVLYRLYTRELVDQLISPEDFDVFFYNRETQKDISQSDESDKGLFAAIIYPLALEDLGHLPRENVVLVDDSDDNCNRMRSRGFTAIHFPSTEQGRKDGTSFSLEIHRVFTMLHTLIEIASCRVQILSRKIQNADSSNLRKRNSYP